MISLIAAAICLRNPLEGAEFTSIKGLLEKNGFVLKQLDYDEPHGPFLFSAVFRSKDGRFWLDVAAQVCDSQADRSSQMRSWEPNGSPEPGRFHDPSPSGIKLGVFSHCVGGEHLFREAKMAEYHFSAIADRFYAKVGIGTGPQGPLGERDQSVAKAPLWCERMTRRILAEAMAIDLDDDGSVRSKAHHTDVEADKTGYQPLETWARAHKVKVAYDAMTEVASFTWRNHAIRLPLASDVVFLGTRELDLGHKFILARGDRWFVPTRELEAAIG